MSQSLNSQSWLRQFHLALKKPVCYDSNWLPEAECRDRQTFLLHTAKERVFQQVRRNVRILDDRWPGSKLANGDSWLQQGQNDIHITCWNIQISANEVRSQKWSEYISTSRICSTVESSKAVCSRVCGRFIMLSRSFKDHFGHIRQSCAIFRVPTLKKLRKIFSSQDSMEYFGHFI